MEKEELQKIIDQLEAANSKDEAFFGVYRYGGPGEEFIKANKQGLELFAADILRASRDAKEILSDKEKTICVLNYEEAWIDDESEVLLQYVEPVGTRAQALTPISETETFKEKAFIGGCIFAVVVAVISAIVGLVTITSWLLNQLSN